ncbi:MAG: FAD-binding oxidoreductase [Gammaproteobacteria bacterium]
MLAPPGVSIAEFSDVLRAFRHIVGAEWVLTDKQHLQAYQDPYSPLQWGSHQPRPSAVVLPQELEELQQIVRIANSYRTPLWILSTGKNFPYGGPEARVDGSIILNLERMNRILELDADNYYALVEPGVTHFDLWQAIRKQGYPLWIDSPGPAHTSILSSTLERATSNGLAGDSFAQICGIEIILANGSQMRTGTGAIPGSQSWQQQKYGLGPYIDGLFSQSNLGIVTKLGVWLLPEPEHFMLARVIVPKYEDISTLIDVLKPLRMSGTIRNSLSITPYTGSGSSLRQIAPIGKERGSGWLVNLGFYGNEAIISAQWRDTQSKLTQAIAKVQTKTYAFSAPYDPEHMQSDAKLIAGIPSFAESQAWDHHSLLTSLLLPNIGSHFFKAIQLIKNISNQYDWPAFTVHLYNRDAHSLMLRVRSPIGTDQEDGRKVVRMMTELIIQAGKAGYGEARAPLLYMDQAMNAYRFNDGALLKFYEQLKDALDPRGILAPGKNGIWPKVMRPS